VRFSSASRDAQHIPGLDTVVYMSATGAVGTARVHCKKHDKWIEVDISLLDDGLTRRDKIQQAFKNCSGCLEIEAAKNTRFPEGAEL